MNKLSLLLQEEDRHIHLAELGTEILRELFMAAKKLAVYPPEHPQALCAVERPLLLFGKWFNIFTVADVECDHGVLYVAGIEAPRGPFSDGLARDLEALALHRVVFLPGLSGPDLLNFLERTNARVPLAKVDQYMWNFLKSQNIDRICVNDEEWEHSFARRRRVRVEDARELSVENLVLAEWGDHTELVSAVTAGYSPDAETLRETYGCFFTPRILQQVLPDRFAAIAPEDLMELVTAQLGDSTTALSTLVESSSRLDFLRHLVSAFQRHPRRRDLMELLRQHFHRHGMSETAARVLDAQSRVQLEVMGEVDHLTTRVFSTACTQEDLGGWSGAFARLLRCGFSEKPQSVLAALLLHLKRDDRDARRKAQFLLGRALGAATATGHPELVGWLAERMTSDVVHGEDTFEYSDLLAGAGEQLITAGRLDLLAVAAGRMRQAINDGAPLSERLVATHVLDRWSQPHLVTVLMRVVTEELPGDAARAMDVLAAVAGAEVARQAAARVTHSERRVRLAMLKLLAELGKDALQICVELLAPDELWVREADESRLADRAWYTVRNALHILGRLEMDGALSALRPHLADPDPRVRKELVCTFERIGGEDALRYLVLLAEDQTEEVRQAAIVALGATGSEHEVFVLRELFASDAGSAEKILFAIGHIGGRQAKEFLFNVLEDDAVLERVGYGNRRAALREVALKALVQNPDAEIVQRIETYCHKHDRTFRIPFVTDALEDTAKLSLDRARLRVRDGS